MMEMNSESQKTIEKFLLEIKNNSGFFTSSTTTEKADFVMNAIKAILS
jgi:hypothetical protein